MQRGGAWFVLAAVAWCARAGPGPPAPAPDPAPDAEPELRFTHALYNVSVPENSAPRTYCAVREPDAAPPAALLPAPGARLRFRIRHGDRDKFFKAEERCVGDRCFLLLRTRAGHADVLNRERKDRYRLEVRASAVLPSGRALDADAVVVVTVDDENDLSPLFYPTEYEASVPEDLPLHASVARVRAEDADLGLNGEIYYALEGEDAAAFAVHPTSGLVTLTRRLIGAGGAKRELTVLARDRAALRDRGPEAPAARAALTVRVTRCNLHAPELRARHLPALRENSTAQLYAIVEARDADEGAAGRVRSVDIVDGDPDGHFRVRPSAQPGEWDVAAHALLDREASPRGYNLTLRAQDAGEPSRSAYLTLPVKLVDANDDAPVFARELYEASVPETAPPGAPLVRLKVSDRDEGRNARVHIEIVGGNEGGEFRLNPDTGVLYTALPLDAERKALYHLTVSAIDQGDVGARHQSSAKVQVAVLDANDNEPVFEREEMRITVAENGPAGAVVACVQARDADSGDNAYLSYSLANLQPVPFDVDPFTGCVRAARLLDYESMRREWELRVRASDWGAPYRRQAEMRLLVRLEDVNDNRPQFERVECVAHLPRRLPPGTEIATLSAIDFDVGDVVSYRIGGGNDDGCFSLEPTTGVLSLACDLTEVRADTRLLNVTATDGTHFADATTLTLHLSAGAGMETGAGSGAGALQCRDAGVARRLADLLAAAARANAPLDRADDFPQAPARLAQNLHAPEFIDFPVEVKVNESVALGTSLVRLRARDRDLGYNGLITYGISGGDPDSAFRVDPDSGELQVIGYLDREREAEYYLNVTAWDQGRPRRAVSRLLPVTVLDVNDNAPRFERALASFRVTENALNGTVVFRASATDRDAGEFARLSYSLRGAGVPPSFCVDAATGALAVCAPLDRERRALYELSVLATDGGGLTAEARVRVAVDDVNDNAPRFPLASYAARVREDLPPGALVAVLEAFDPDLDAGGRVTYSLGEGEGDADGTFAVDPESGAVRTLLALDYERRQVYGVTVRATDGGVPALWAETALVLEVEDVDENAHAPRFPAPGGVVSGAVPEDAPVGSAVLRVAAADADPPGRDSRLAYYIAAGDGMAHFNVDDTGTVRTLTPLDRETVDHYWLTLCAHDHGLVPKHTCIEVYIEVTDVNDMAPWPTRAAYAGAVPEDAPAGTGVLRVQCEDADRAPAPAPLRYSIVAGNPDGLFSVDESTGAIATTGRALGGAARSLHALEVRCSDGALAGAARVLVSVLDVNDHAPAFLQRHYELRVPEPLPDSPTPPPLLQSGASGAGGEESSTEWESDDEEEGSGRAAAAPWEQAPEDAPGHLYLGTVLALDSDAGANGTVRYWARTRGAARGVLRVSARSGRVTAAGGGGSRLRAGAVLEMTLRACDAGSPPRCGTARATLRVLPRGGGAAPRLAPPPPLQAAELDAPGFLLAVLQATDPDGDALYYDIVDGDPSREFRLGRADGSLVLAERLVWERRPRYDLNVSVTDGLNTVYATVVINVVNDGDEGGVSFEQEEVHVEVEAGAGAGAEVTRLRARAAAGGRLLYGLQASRAPASLALFRLHELSGALTLQRPLPTTPALHELTVWARDSAPRASCAYARVAVTVRGRGRPRTPAWGRRLAEARLARGAAPGTLVASLRAGGPRGAALRYSLAGGDAGGLFAVEATRGDVVLQRALSTPSAAREYTLHVRAELAPPADDVDDADDADVDVDAALAATLPLHVIIVEPDDAPPRFESSEIVCEVYENEPAGAVLASVEARGAAGTSYSLQGGAGLFALSPSSGLLVTAAPLDHELCSLYNLTVTALAMGGGEARARVSVHVLDRNEFPPRLSASRYRGRVSEAQGAGSLVWDANAPLHPLVLRTEDADSPAHQQRAFEVLPPSAAALFRVDAATGALRTVRALDYERATRHEFTVRVMDAGEPRQPSDSEATVVVEVGDVNDCPPRFERSAYEATVLLPTAVGVEVLALPASDADPPPDGTLLYDIMEGDAEGAFALSSRGVLTVARSTLAAEYRLRVRASDGRYASTARVDIRTRDVDNAGLAFHKAEYRGSVLENSTRPATIVVLNVLGAALNEHVHFRILNPTDGFEVGATSGAVRSSGLALDREARDAYTLLVEARSEGAEDGAGGEARVARVSVHVAVTDVNDNCPVFVEQPYAAAVLAGAEPGASVLQVRARDADAGDNGEVRYEMKRGHGELFRVDRRSGEITLKQTVDAHNQLYTLVIAAFDGGVPACGAEAVVEVRVWGGGAAPAWERARFALEAREDAAPGSALGAPLRAISPLNRQLIYTLLDADGGADSPLEIHFDTATDGGNNPCVVVARAELDYETQRELSAVLRATDSVTGVHADAALSVTLLDVNDNAPEFPQDTYRASVSEAAMPGDLVLALRATDLDEGANGEVTYSLSALGEGAGGADEFSIDPTSGEVRVAAPLDAETRAAYHLRVTAADAGRPSLLSTAHLFITVEDVNDSAPRMERALVGGAVSAEASRGTALARAGAWDADACDATRLRYRLEGAAAGSRAFRLHARTGVLTLSGAAPASAAALRTLNVSVSDGAHAAFARIKLALAPCNLAAPAFPHLVQEARVLENLPAGALLSTVQARDADAGEYGAVAYSLPSARLRDTFALDARSGALRTRVPLDRETREAWEVPLQASDGGGLLAHTTVRVRVVDANDNAPEFPLLEYRACVRADRAPTAPFLTLTARDADAGENARLTYSVYEGDVASDSDVAGLFRVDSVTGALSFARDATRYASRSVVVWVRARDAGGLSGEAPVTVYILGAGESPPAVRALPPALSLREDAAPGALLAALHPPAGVRLRLAPARAPPGLFALDAAARLLLAGPLDREAAADHVIGIIAESGAAAVTLLTRLHVMDVNEHAPTFHSQPYVVHLAENAPPHSSVLRLMAEDPDAGSNGEVRYSLAPEAEQEGEGGALFAVDPFTGWVTTLGPLDREARAEHRLALVASDGGSPRRVTRGTLVVRLVDYNDCPPAFSRAEYSCSVREDAAPGTVATRLTLEDADATQAPLSFFIADGDPRARFQLRASGELYVARALDRETEPSFELSVAATDGKFTAYTRVRVTVLDVNDNPPYCVRHRYRVRLREDAAPGTAVTRLETGDADGAQHAQLRYYLTGSHAERFAIAAESGAVSVATPLDRESTPQYRLTMHAADRSRADWACASLLEVQLEDVNDNAPRFSSDTYSVTLPEDADLGTLVAKVHATDLDLGENRSVLYSWAEGEGGGGGEGGAFSLDPLSGIVTLRAALDRETQAEHRAVVRATDGGRPPRSATATLRLTVADVNDNPPEFERREYRVSVSELDAPGAELLRVRATSRDDGDNARVLYALVGGEDRGDFALDAATGALSVARPLDYERRRAYLLTVQAVDGGRPPLSDLASVNVTLVDANDNAPRFSRAEYAVRVREDAAPGARLLRLDAEDADAAGNGRVAYAIARGDPEGRFSVDAESGLLVLAAALDRETQARYTLEVVARDGGEPALEGSALVSVEVLDANDNAPRFDRSSYSAVVREDRPLGHAILRFQVTDADAPPNGPPFTFDFQAGNEMGAFRLEQDGFLRTARRFNHRLKQQYELQVRVFDNGVPPLYSDTTVLLRVAPESLHPPVVSALHVAVCSYLDEFPGGVIGRVHASDRDADDALEYALAPPSDPLFEIDSGTGELRAAPALDVGEYRLNATVSDGRFLSSASVRVSVALLTDETLASAVAVRFREVSAPDFVLRHRRGFMRAVAEAADVEPADVLIVSVQASGDDERPQQEDEEDRAPRQVARDLDVAFAVREGPGAWLGAEPLRRRLHAHLERLEERAQLVVEELVRATCGGCAQGVCAERVELVGAPRAISTELAALVTSRHALRGWCACAPGWSGARCAEPAPRGEQVCASCEEARVLQLAGDGFLEYRLERGAVQGARAPEDELLVSLRFRTRRPRGTLLALTGRVDGAVLEVTEGYLQFRMELGAGEALVRAAVPVADGRWHEARLERRGGGARLTVDRRSAHAQTPGTHAVLDVRPSRRMLVGAQLVRHEHASADEQVTYGFEGCISGLRLGGEGGGGALPLEAGGTSRDGRVQLSRRVRVRVGAACAALPPPDPCASYPCLHGGTCRALPASLEGEGYECACHVRYLGPRCERDSDPCASAPCLHGGACRAEGSGFRCSCPPPLQGERCERGRYCAEGACEHGGACEEGDAAPSCRCRGYYGPRCELDVDECAGEPCLNGATCLNEPGSFRCLCPPDKTGMNCGNPLYSDAVTAGGGEGSARVMTELWHWALEARWPLAAGGAALLLLALLGGGVVPLCRRRRRAAPPPPPPYEGKAALLGGPKLSNLEAVGRRERPASCAEPPPAPLNNVDTLRSYGSAGDELEGIPPDYRRNLNINVDADRKPWSDQMHLHTFRDHKIYNDLKGTRGARSPPPAPGPRPRHVGGGVGAGAGGDLVGGYHWDCSDWCGGGGALPGISEVAGSERPDSSSGASPPPPSPRAALRRRVLPLDSDSAPDDADLDKDAPTLADASSYLLHPDEYLPRACMEGAGSAGRRRARDPDAASLITMLEERTSLLGGSESARSCSSLSARLCEIEDSDAEEEEGLGPGPGGARHTDV